MAKRVKKRKKKKFKIIRIFIALLILAVIGFGAMKGIEFLAANRITKEYYIASNTNEIATYVYNEETKKMDEKGKIIRGKKIISHDKIKTIDEINYYEVFEGEDSFYIKEDNLVTEKEKAVTETEKYVRTSVTVYKNEKVRNIRL